MSPTFETTLAMWMPGGWELVVIVIVGLLLFGGRLPEVGKSLGRSLIEFRKGLRNIKEDVGLGELDNVRREIQDATRPNFDEFYDEANDSYDDGAVDAEVVDPETRQPTPADPEESGETPDEPTDDSGTVEAPGDAPGDTPSNTKVPTDVLGDGPASDDSSKSDGDKPPAFGYSR